MSVELPFELQLGYSLNKGVLYDENNVPIANFVVVPLKVYCLNGEPFPSFCDLEVVREGEHIHLPGHMSIADLSSSWWKKFTKPGCFYYEGKALYRKMERLFHAMLGKLEPINIIQPDSLGWITSSTGEYIYVTGNGAINANGFAKDNVWIPNKLSQYQLETLQTTSFDEAMDYFWKLYRMKPGITDILLANAFAAFLRPCFEAAKIDAWFSIILEGPSGVKKTTLACLTSCLYNRRSDLRSSIAELTSTKRALERHSIEQRHAPLIIDDLFPDGNSGMKQKAVDLFREIANHISRRSCSGNEVKGTRMECGAVFTVEKFPNCEESTRTRCLRLNLNKAVPNALLTPLQEKPELLGNVFQMFIMKIAKNFDEIKEKAEKYVLQYRRDGNMFGAHDTRKNRYGEMIVILHSSLKIFFTQVCGPNLPQINNELKSFDQRLRGIIDWQLTPETAPNRGQLIEATAQLVKRYPQKFLRRSGCVCIQPGNLCELLRRHLGDRTITVRDITRQLRDGGLLSIDRSNKSTKKIVVNGQHLRYLHINEQKLLG